MSFLLANMLSPSDEVMATYSDEHGVTRAWAYSDDPDADPAVVKAEADRQLDLYLAKHPSLTKKDFTFSWQAILNPPK